VRARDPRSPGDGLDVDGAGGQRGRGGPSTGRGITFVVEYHDAQIGGCRLRQYPENAQVEQDAAVPVEGENPSVGRPLIVVKIGELRSSTVLLG
jgi:hypothetical protein